MKFIIARSCILVLAATLAACDRRVVITDRDTAPWVTVTQNPSIRVALDTSRIQSDSLGKMVWVRFDYTVTNPPMTEMPQPWRRMESRHLLDCAGRRAKDLAMIVIDTAGMRHDGSQVLSPAWQSFDNHGLTTNVLTPACVVVANARSRRGA